MTTIASLARSSLDARVTRSTSTSRKSDASLTAADGARTDAAATTPAPSPDARSKANAADVYLHSAVDGYSRLAYTEALPDEKATTAIGFMHRSRAWFAAHGITRIERIVTDNGACYRADAFARAMLGARHQRINPYTPRHNGKVERYNRILAEEFLYAHAWTSEQERANALGIWNIHYNYHRPHSAAGGQPPASRLTTGVTNLMASYT